jgi:hypothetical protein
MLLFLAGIYLACIVVSGSAWIWDMRNKKAAFSKRRREHSAYSMVTFNDYGSEEPLLEENGQHTI